LQKPNHITWITFQTSAVGDVPLHHFTYMKKLDKYRFFTQFAYDHNSK